MRLLLPLILLCSAPVFAADSDHAISQAKHFVKKGWLSDAVQELEKATQTESGRTSFEVHAMLAQIRFQQADAQKAYDTGQRALELSTDPGETSEIRRLVEFIDDNFGTLHLISPYPGMEASLEIESELPILDPEVERFYTTLKERLNEKTVLPLSLRFPAGSYQINRLQTVVNPGKESTLNMSMGALGASGLSALQVSRIEFSMGTGIVASERTNNLRPSLDLQFSISQPIGAWIAGAQFDYSIRSFSVEGEGFQSDPLSYSAGIRFGREIMLGGPLAFRPSLGYRFGYLPGIALACESSDPLDPFTGPYTCRVPGDADGEPDLRVYAIARAHIPFAELALDYRRSGKTSAVGLGIKVIGEAVAGGIREQDKAIVEGSGEEVAYSTTATSFTAASIRMLANFSFAF